MSDDPLPCAWCGGPTTIEDEDTENVNYSHECDWQIETYVGLDFWNKRQTKLREALGNPVRTIDEAREQRIDRLEKELAEVWQMHGAAMRNGMAYLGERDTALKENKELRRLLTWALDNNADFSSEERTEYARIREILKSEPE